MNREHTLLTRIRILTAVFIFGLVLSGITAIPLTREVDYLARVTGARDLVDQPGSTAPPAWATWLVRVQTALEDVSRTKGFLFYGADWLAFGHFMIALAFLGALRDPVRNAWLFSFGMIACILVIPYALVCGAMRGIPVWWRLIDCSFGIIGMVPLAICRKWVNEVELVSTKP